MPFEIATDDEQPGLIWVILTQNTAGDWVGQDYSSGYTFTCKVLNKDTGAVLLTKTTGITGSTGGVITIAFTGAELTAAGVTGAFNAPGQYKIQLRPRRTADSADGPTRTTDLLVLFAA